MLTKTKPKLAAIVVLWFMTWLAIWLASRGICVRAGCGVPTVDATLMSWVHGWQHPLLDGFFRAITWLGSMYLLLPASLILALWFWRAGARTSALFVPGAMAGAWTLGHLAKAAVMRPRPDAVEPLVAMPGDWSFPSSHALQAAAFALALALRPGIRPCGLLVMCAAVVAVFVGLSRVYLQVHFPTDVLAGFVAAAVWVLGLRIMVGQR